MESAPTLAGALALVAIKKPEPDLSPTSPDGQRHFFAEMREGIKVVTGNMLLWTQAGCTGMWNLGSNIFAVAVLLFALDTMDISKGIIGIVFSIGAVGFFIGVLISSAVTNRLGFGRTIALSTAGSFGQLIVLLATPATAIYVIGASYFVTSIGIPIYNINQVSLRQIITPNRLQGRMNATMRTIVWGTIPAGSLVGGGARDSLGHSSYPHCGRCSLGMLRALDLTGSNHKARKATRAHE